MTRFIGDAARPLAGHHLGGPLPGRLDPLGRAHGPGRLAYDINQLGRTAQFTTLWTHFNGDPVMTIYLLIYIIGHLLSAVLIGFMLGRLHLVPAWAAWAFALTSPLTIPIILIHNLVYQDVLKYLICVLWFMGAIPAALAMLNNKDVMCFCYSQ